MKDGKISVQFTTEQWQAIKKLYVDDSSCHSKADAVRKLVQMGISANRQNKPGLRD